MNLENAYFLDGLACVGKSTFLQENHFFKDDVKLDVCLHDLTEMIEKEALFKYKTEDVVIQMLYSINWITDLKNNTIFDRSPLSDFWYHAVSLEMNGNCDGIYFLEYWLNNELFRSLCSKFKHIFILPLEMYDDIILRKMIDRKNGIDVCTMRYVKAQRDIFEYIKSRDILNFHFIILKEEIFSQNYFEEWINKMQAIDLCIFKHDMYGLEELIQQRSGCFLLRTLAGKTTSCKLSNRSCQNKGAEKNKIYTDSVFERKYEEDAGFDLTVAENVICYPNVPMKIPCVEKVFIPKNKFALLCARSSTNLIGNVRVGIIDSHYTGTLSGVFVADKLEKIEKGRRLFQLVFMNCDTELTKITALSALNVSNKKRCSNGFGSTSN